MIRGGFAGPLRTNHLDIHSRGALIRAINEFPGAMLVISHDAHLIELTADRLWLVADGLVQPFAGDLDDDRRSLLNPGVGNAPSDPTGSADERRSERQRRADPRARVAPLRQTAQAAERELERLSEERAALAARLADGATYDRSGDEIAA